MSFQADQSTDTVIHQIAMGKTRAKISDELAAKVMFASDQTCCVCRNAPRKVEIHHIDGDPSNNDFANLAVVCKDCQSDAHTDHSFARNLTSDLVRKYNESWQATVRARLSPGGEPALVIEYQQQVLLDVVLAPHIWKNHYMGLYPGHFEGCSSSGGRGDIWDALVDCAVHKYSLDEWKKYVPLFDGSITHVVDVLQRLLTAHGSVVPTSIKLAILRTSSLLDRERSLYLRLPGIIERFFDDANGLLAERFRAVIRSLSSLARMADNERRELEPDT